MYRIEKDSLGTRLIPYQARYGIHTQRALDNFAITGRHIHPEMIRAFLTIKEAAAYVNMAAGQLDADIGQAIIQATTQLMAQPISLDDFPLDPIQGGAGTSLNMNVNEVIANTAARQAQLPVGTYHFVHPNDHVNMSQSTNDTYPSAGKIALIRLLEPLFEALTELIDALGSQADAFATTYKMGRTQLQDAVPMTLGESFHAWLKPLRRDLQRLTAARNQLYALNLGGSAIGSGINVPYHYHVHIARKLEELTKLPLTQAHDLYDATQNLDTLVTLSSALKILAVNLSKMSNDLRLLSSGPRSGLHELILPAKQAGSSIMPGKVNPVIPEVVNQVAFSVFGNDATITAAAEAGQLELNAFEPVVFDRLVMSITELTQAMITLRDNAIIGITADRQRLHQDIDLSISFATAMAPIIGYQPAAQLAKRAIQESANLRDLAVASQQFTSEQLQAIFNVADIVLNARTPEHGLVLRQPR
jgi:aspartate ammonia-lyase